jgi:class 3 adenylate cyclase
MNAKPRKRNRPQAPTKTSPGDEASIPARSTPPPFDHVIEGYERALFLDHFLEAGRVPSVSDLEIAVCFADLRGFTKYVDLLQASSADSRVHEFLGAYFQIYPKAILELVYALEQRGTAKITAEDEQIRRSIVPSAFKTLGDGMMLVWELPRTRALQDKVSARILQVITTIQRLFRALIKEHANAAAAPYSVAVGNLRLGFGLARGRAWRFDFGARRPVDYAGNIVNLAARLQDRARPEGIVADVGFCDPVFRLVKRNGRATEISVKGREKPVSVWASPEVKLDS